MASRKERNCYTYEQAAEIITAMSDDEEDTNDIVVLPCNERGDQGSEADNIEEENLFFNTVSDVAGQLKVHKGDMDSVEDEPIAKRNR